MTTSAPTASLLIIGDEILAGRTKDKNIAYMGEYLSGMGIDLVEVRIVPDQEDKIVEAVNALRAHTTYVFTTGGIGPTHDDITADAIAKAFGVSIGHDPRAVALLKTRYKPEDLNDARLRMARLPAGASLIENTVSTAPGFRIGNVMVMAGVPSIMQVMLDAVAPTLKGGVPPKVVSIDAAGVPEGKYADDLRVLAERYPDVTMGSYPSFTPGAFSTKIVLRSRDEAMIETAACAVRSMLDKLKSAV